MPHNRVLSLCFRASSHPPPNSIPTIVYIIKYTNENHLELNLTGWIQRVEIENWINRNRKEQEKLNINFVVISIVLRNCIAEHPLPSRPCFPYPRALTSTHTGWLRFSYWNGWAMSTNSRWDEQFVGCGRWWSVKQKAKRICVGVEMAGGNRSP